MKLAACAPPRWRAFSKQQPAQCAKFSRALLQFAMRKDCGMRNAFVTKFWQQAYERLPVGTREQYFTQMQSAERWELALGDVIELCTRAKNAILRLFQAPSRAH